MPQACSSPSAPLRLTCTHGPARSFADWRGTTLRLKHRLQLRDGASKKMTRACHQDDARTATGNLREDSSFCQRVGAVVLPNHPQLIAACEAVLEEAARSRTLNPPHWRRAARSGLSLRESPSPKVGPGGDLSCVVFCKSVAVQHTSTRYVTEVGRSGQKWAVSGP